MAAIDNLFDPSKRDPSKTSVIDQLNEARSSSFFPSNLLPNLDIVETYVLDAKKKFDAIKGNNVEQISYKEVLTKLSTPEFFEQEKYRDGYNIIFDNLKPNPADSRLSQDEKDKAEKHILEYAKNSNPNITKDNVVISYIASEKDT